MFKYFFRTPQFLDCSFIFLKKTKNLYCVVTNSTDKIKNIDEKSESTSLNHIQIFSSALSQPNRMICILFVYLLLCLSVHFPVCQSFYFPVFLCLSILLSFSFLVGKNVSPEHFDDLQ
jgi:hypothetical protein